MQNQAEAQNRLGLMYKSGRGVSKDFVQAHAWYNVASANGDSAAKDNLLQIEDQMTPTQVTEAIALGHELLKKISTP